MHDGHDGGEDGVWPSSDESMHIYLSPPPRTCLPRSFALDSTSIATCAREWGRIEAKSGYVEGVVKMLSSHTVVSLLWLAHGIPLDNSHPLGVGGRI